ncbi:V-type ATP synthase subunit C [Candidatus Poribacteria bacterium]|nr:MAG: V-type ATP synthase subunit C [Candidatus Poribacteria bacterium]
MFNRSPFELLSDDTRYAFAVGKIKVLETRMLSRAELQRMLEAPSPQEALAVLMDSPYEEFLSGLESPLEFERALNEELRRTYELVDSLSYDKELTDLLRLRWDFHNLKVMLKAHYLGVEPEGEAIVDFGTLDPASIREAVEEERGEERLPEPLRSALVEARAEFEESGDPQMIDISIEGRMLGYLAEKAAEYPNGFLEGYFRRVIDLNNIRNFIRLKMMGANVRLIERALVEGGYIPKRRLMRMMDEGISEIPALLGRHPYEDVVGPGVQDLLETRSMATFERLMDNHLINYLRPAKYAAFGVEPLIAYLLAKEHEVKLIRIIMIGKINGLPNDQIEGRLREPYV